MDVVRTPDERFTDLPDFPFEPHYAEIPADPADPGGATLRVHYLDEGPADADPVLTCTASRRGASCTAT